MSKKVRVAIIGVGNCASSLVQGVEFYRNASEGQKVPGLMHVNLGGYHISDVEFSAAFDINITKVGKDLSEAILAEPNCTVKLCDVPNLGVKVNRGMTHDGLGKYLKEVIQKAPGPTSDIVGILKETKTDEGYISILEDLLLASRVPVFKRRAKRAVTGHPKFYYFDTGVFRSLRPKGPLDRLEEINGAALEGLIFQHLKAWSDYRGQDVKLYYWRTRSGTEVDFILYGTGCFRAIEVKNTAEIRSGDLKPLKSFRDDYPECMPLMLYRGTSSMVIDGILCMPVYRFLQELHPDKGLPQRHSLSASSF